MGSRYLDRRQQGRLRRHEYRFEERLDGRLVLVAGGTGGLGPAVAARLMGGGARVVLGYVAERERAAAVAAALGGRYGPRPGVVEADITSEPGRARLLEAVDLPELYGAVVCVGDPARVPAAALGMEALEASWRVNLAGPMLLARAIAGLLAARRQPGALVLLSSMQGQEVFPGSLAYAAPKAALAHGARILAHEYGGRLGIRVNVVAPGVTTAGMALASIERGKYDAYVDEGVIPRFGTPEDVARAVYYLMLPDSYVTGQVLVVDGGLTLRRGALAGSAVGGAGGAES